MSCTTWSSATRHVRGTSDCRLQARDRLPIIADKRAGRQACSCLRATARRTCREATMIKLIAAAHIHLRRRARRGDRRRSASARRCCSDKAEAQRTNVQAPMFEVDPFWPKPLPNNWLLGMAIGVWVDEQDHVWIIHRGAGDAAQQREGRRAQSADRRVLPRRAARAGVRSGGQSGALLGRPGPGLRVAAVEPRHPRRLQGQRLDRRQRREGRARPEVHQGRQVPDAGRRAPARTPAATISRTSAASPRSGSIRRPTRPTSPTAISTSAWR